MEKKTIHATAAGMLRQVLNKPQQVPTPGEEPKPIEPAPAEPATPLESIN